MNERIHRVSHELRTRVDALIMDLFPAARRSGAYWSIGSIAGEPGKSLYIKRSGGNAGKWTDEATGEHGDMLDLIKAVQSTDTAAAVTWADQWLGNGALMLKPRWPEKRQALTPTPEFDDDDLQRAIKAYALWREAVAIKGTPAETYLRNRGVRKPLPPSLKYHPALPYWEPRDGEKPSKFWGNRPALVCAIQQPDNKITAIHRIWIKPDGSGKDTELPKPKMAYGPIGKGAIRLAHAGRTLGEAEGVEKSLAAMELYSLPVWCPVSASRLGGFTLPEIVQNSIIFGDHDPVDGREFIESPQKDGTTTKRPNPMFGKRPGEVAALRAIERRKLEGVSADAEFPEIEEQDWDDILRLQRAA